MAAHPRARDAEPVNLEWRRVRWPGKDENVMTEAADLRSWRDTDTRRAIVAFVQGANESGGPGYVPPAERIAVFDNDGTLWTEKPMPIQLDFIMRGFAEAVEREPALREQQPFKAAHERDFGWLGHAMVKHYQGDDGDLKLLFMGLSKISVGVEVEAYADQVTAFFEDARHPTFERPYVSCGYVPMIELLRYLEANGFLTFIVSGGDRDFMRPVAERIYQIPRERVVGSGFGVEYRDGTIVYSSKLDAFDDGPEKPLRIWARTGRRPAIAAGNSNGDLEMLRFAGGADKPALRLVVRHDDAEREVADTSGAERVLDAGFTEISMRDDWATVFAP
jgi:phosphoserine phosphatase